MIYVLYPLHVLVCLFLIFVVLLQQGKGADLSVFGGGSTQTAFGARSATTLLHKLTVGSFVIFVITTMSIGILQTHASSTGTVMKNVAGAKAPASKPAPVKTDPAKPAPAAPAQPAPGKTP